MKNNLVFNWIYFIRQTFFSLWRVLNIVEGSFIIKRYVVLNRLSTNSNGFKVDITFILPKGGDSIEEIDS